MQSENPYASPQQVGELLFAATPAVDRTAVVETIAGHLTWSRRWIIVLAVVLSIFAMLTCLLIVSLLVRNRGAVMAEIVTLGVILGVVALLSTVAAMILFNASSHISQFIRQPSAFRLEQVVRSQNSFLNLVGLSVAVITVLYAASVVFTMFGMAWMGI